MKRWVLAGFMLVALAPIASAAEGLVSIKSGFPVKETIDRLERTAREKGMTVFLRVDHAAGAAKIGTALRPTELLIFGNPQGGTPLLQCAQSAGIDLPLKALAWQDMSGQVWLGYNDPAYVAKRHEIEGSCGAAIEAMSKAISGLARAAAQP